MYRYLNNPRLQFFFISPNTCAAWLAMMIMLLFGFAHVCLLHKEKKYRWTAYCVFSVVMGLSYMLSMTYSRGGILAILLSMTVYSALTRSKMALAWIAMFLLGIFLWLPSGTDRMLSTAHINDGSIAHRLWLWRGACGLTAMRPYCGWKPNDCGKLYAQWYRPEQVTENYRTMINDTLTISVRHGLPVLFSLLLIIFAVLWLAGRIAYTSHDKILAALVCACLSYLVASCFSTLYEQPEVVSWFLCLVIATICFTVGRCLLNKFNFKLFDCCIPVIAALLVCGTIWLIGCFVNAGMSFRHFEYRQMSQDMESKLVLSAFPNQTPKALIIFFLPDAPYGGGENIYGLPSFREWLKDGYAIVSVALESGLQGFEASKIVLTTAFEVADGLPVLAVGVGNAGNYALLNCDAKARSLGLYGFIGIYASLDWPLESLSPLAHASKIEVSGYLIDNQNDGMDKFLYVAKVEEKTVQGLLLSETSTGITLREKTAKATPLAMQLAAQLLQKKPSP